MVHEFKSSKRVGNIGETIFKSLLEQAGIPVKDVSEEPEWRKKGVDFVAGGVLYDTKHDTKTEVTGNIAVETVSRKVDGVVETPGWIYTSEADYIVYIYQIGDNWIVHFFTNEAFREMASKNMYPLREVRNRGYEAEVMLVPIKDLQDFPKIKVPVVSRQVNVDMLRLIHVEALDGKQSN